MNAIYTTTPTMIGRYLWAWAVTVDSLNTPTDTRIIPLWRRTGEMDWHTPADFPGAVPAGVANLLTDGKALIALARAYESQTASIIP